MRIEKKSPVVMLQVAFDPGETRLLRAHPKWASRISVSGSRNNGHAPDNLSGRMSVSRSQLQEIADVLGLKGDMFVDFIEAENARLKAEKRKVRS